MSADHQHDSARECGVPLEDLIEDLIDLDREELSPERSAELSRHTEGCPDCLAELESLRSARAAARSVEIAPSPGFRGKLMSRIREAAASVESVESVNNEHAREGRASPVKGLRIVGPATRRLARIVEREREVTAWFRPRWKLAVLASSAAAVLAAVMITKVWVQVVPVGTGGVAKRRPQLIEERATMARFKERAECALSETGRRMERLDGSWLDVSAIVEVAGDEEVVLTGTIDPQQQENCLLAFRASDWELFADRYECAAEGRELDRFRRIASSKQVVQVRDGRIEIPRVLLVKHVSGPDVVVLRLKGRAEIWSPASLEAYTEHGIPRAIGVDLEG
ncbi:MAG: hypothetical protein ACYTFI_26205 [Planctomycetota bacterium]